jgi:diguanylate cyclase (GGDEF)-like protein
MRARERATAISKLLLVPGLPVVMLWLAIREGTPVPEPNVANALSETLMVCLAAAWLVLLHPRRFYPITLFLLGAGVTLLYAGCVADLFDEFYELPAIVTYIEDLAIPVGMITVSAGLVLRLREHRRAYQEIAIKEQEFRRLSMTDSLTGLYNSKRFFDMIGAEVRRARRYGRNLALGFLDIDNFKTFNDENGHLEGDRLLREVARVIRAECRENDTAFRYGGEEFTILFPETDMEQAFVVANRIRESVAGTRLQLKEGRSEGRTVSIGVAVLSDDTPSIKDLIDRADKAMYRAKLQGKNRVQAE